MEDEVKVFSGRGNEQYRIVDRMYNGRKARVLFSEDGSPQSGLALDNDPQLLFNYNQRFLEIVASIHPKKILIIGGGAFTLPKAILERFANTTVDVIEIDALLPQLARRYFSLPETGKLRTIISDGRKYINECHETYDIIILDAFSDSTIPYSLLTREAVKEYERCLSDIGLIAINFISAYPNVRETLASRLFSTFRIDFKSVDIYPADHTESRHRSQNLVLVASKQKAPALDYLQSVAVPQSDAMVDMILRDI